MRGLIILLSMLLAGWSAGQDGAAMLLVIGQAAQPDYWTPADLGNVVVWLDASDGSTLWADTSGTVAATNLGIIARWDDKTTNGYNATALTTDYPTLSGGKVSWADKTVARRLQSPAITISQPYNIAAVWSCLNDATAGSDSRLCDGRTAATGIIEAGDGGGTNRYVRTYAGTFITPEADVLTPFTNLMTLAYFSGASSEIRLNGSSRTVGNAGTGAFNGFTLGSHRSDTAADARMQGDAHAYIVVSGTMSESDEYKLEGWLAWEYDLTDELPVDHPYKSSRPLVGDVLFPTDGLVAYYGLDGDAYDEVSATSGTLSGSLVSTNLAISGTAYKTTAGRIDTVNSSLLNGASDYTISAWAWQIDHVTYAGICFSRGTRAVGIGRDNNTPAGDVYTASGWSTANQVIGDTVVGSIADGQWVHLVAVGKNVGSNRITELWSDGAMVSAITNAGNDTISQNDIFRIGWDDSSGTRLFNGIIDEVGIWNRALTEQEISDIYTYQLVYP